MGHLVGGIKILIQDKMWNYFIVPLVIFGYLLIQKLFYSTICTFHDIPTHGIPLSFASHQPNDH